MKVLALSSRCDLERRVDQALCSAYFVLDCVNTVADCIAYFRLSPYTGVLVDADSIGFAQALGLVKRLRHHHPSTAIFIVERYLDLEQRLTLFEAGADECIHDPFFASELTVRLSLLIRLRQSASHAVNRLHAGDLEIDLVRRRVTRLGKSIDLRPKEFLLLEYLVRNANRPVTRTMIIEHVWNSCFEGLTNVVDVYISALRTKVDRDFSHKLIQTTRGVGYTLTCAERTAPHSDQAMTDLGGVCQRLEMAI
jgi:two-component system OmpR family response regulator